MSLKASSSFSNFYNTASPWSWGYHSRDISNEPGTLPLGKSLVIGMEEADLASKYLCINNSGISDRKFNIFSCFFHCPPWNSSVEISLPVSMLRAGSLPALRCPLNDLCNIGFWKWLWMVYDFEANNITISMKTVSKSLSVDLNRVLYVNRSSDVHPAPTDLQKARGKGCCKTCRFIKKWMTGLRLEGRFPDSQSAALSVMSHFCKGDSGWTTVQYAHQTAHTTSDLWDWQLAVLIYLNPATCKNYCFSA